MSSAFEEFESGRLWSLWELMSKTRYGDLFVGVAGLSAFAHANCLGRGNQVIQIEADQYNHLMTMSANVCKTLGELNLPLSLISANDLAEVLNKEVEKPNLLKNNNANTFGLSEFTRQRFVTHVEYLTTRLKDELNAVSFVRLASGAVNYYEQKAPIFGLTVNDIFPAASEDISEAGMSFALERYTATVFHLMRSMECALLILGDKLGATIINKNGVNLTWMKIVDNMSTRVNAMDPGPERNRWSKSVTLLTHVGRSWRNDTMHPKQTYTPKEALVIIEAVDAFMNDLAILL